MPSLGVHLGGRRVAPLRGSGASRAARTRPGRLADIGPLPGNRASPSDGARVEPGRSGAGGRGVARDFLGCACRTVTVIALAYTGVSEAAAASHHRRLRIFISRLPPSSVGLEPRRRPPGCFAHCRIGVRGGRGLTSRRCTDENAGGVPTAGNQVPSVTRTGKWSQDRGAQPGARHVGREAGERSSGGMSHGPGPRPARSGYEAARSREDQANRSGFAGRCHQRRPEYQPGMTGSARVPNPRRIRCAPAGSPGPSGSRCV
jgi:hypothetical protein